MEKDAKVTAIHLTVSSEKAKTVKVDIDLNDEPYYISKRVKKDSPLGKKILSVINGIAE